MHLRQGISLAVGGSALLVTVQAYAWREAHLVGDEARVHVDAHGLASIEHILKWRVVHGPLESVDLAGGGVGAGLDPAAFVRTEDGHDLTAHVVRGDDSVVRVVLDSPRALARGVATFDVRWQIDLVATHAIVPDGESWRLSWSLPVAVNGFDLPRILLDLPAAPEPPRSLGGDLSAPEQGGGETDTLRRDGDRDILEIIRPYAAHGESLAGAIRLDPRALSEVHDPSLRPVASPPTSGEPQRWQSACWIGAVGLLGIAFGLLVARRHRAFEAACATGRAAVCGLVPVSRGVRAALAGLTLAAGVMLQILEQPIAGGLLLAVCVLCAALRSARSAPMPRGPGRWFPVRPEDAFRPRGAAWVRGLPWRAGVAALGIVGGAWAAGRLSTQGPWLVVMDSAPFVALFATGRRSQLASVDLGVAGRLLRKTFARLKKTRSLRVVAWGRVGLDGALDELRIRVLPQVAVPGVVGIEMGHAWSRTPVGWAPAPEVMVRILEGSAAAAKIGQAMPDALPLPGRRAQERAFRLVPKTPTASACEGIVRRAAGILTDRRVGSGSHRQEATERRKPLQEPAGSAEKHDWGPSSVDATC
jgi:hypothetical protein